MALYRPGKRSNLTLLLSSIFTLTLLATIIVGHLVLGFYLWGFFTDDSGMQSIATATNMPVTALWISICAALAMDAWIFTHMGKAHEKAKLR